MNFFLKVCVNMSQRMIVGPNQKYKYTPSTLDYKLMEHRNFKWQTNKNAFFAIPAFSKERSIVREKDNSGIIVTREYYSAHFCSFPFYFCLF